MALVQESGGAPVADVAGRIHSLLHAYCGISREKLIEAGWLWDFHLATEEPLHQVSAGDVVAAASPARAAAYREKAPEAEVYCTGFPALYLTPIASESSRPLADALVCFPSDPRSADSMLRHARKADRWADIVLAVNESSISEYVDLVRQGVPVIPVSEDPNGSRLWMEHHALLSSFGHAAFANANPLAAQAIHCGAKLLIHTAKGFAEVDPENAVPWMEATLGKAFRIEPQMLREALGDASSPSDAAATWTHAASWDALLGESVAIAAKHVAAVRSVCRLVKDTGPLTQGWCSWVNAKVAEQRGDWKSCAEAFETVRFPGTPSPRLAADRANAVVQRGLSDAASALEEALNHGGGESSALQFALANTLKAAGDPDRAAECSRRGLALLRSESRQRRETPGRVLIISATAKEEKDRHQLLLFRSFQSVLGAGKGNIDLDITYANRKGLPEVYNAKFREYARAGYEFVIFCHDDVYLDDANLVAKLSRARNAFGAELIGVAGGSRPNIVSPTLWHRMCAKDTWRGAVQHPSSDGSGFSTSVYGTTPAPVDLLDGLFLAVHTESALKTGWSFNGAFRFHHYDLAASLDAKRLGMQSVVYPLNVVHVSPGLGDLRDPEWLRSDAEFVRLYGNPPASSRQF
jgi:hypothetical protein